MMASASAATAGSTTTMSFLRLSTASLSSALTLHILTPGSSSSTARKCSGVSCSLPKTQHAEHGVESGSTKREALVQMAISAVVQVASVSSPARAADDASTDFRIYSDDANKYKISIPQDWQVGAGETDGIISITAFYPDATSSLNVSVVITGIGPDFIKSKSFGKVDAFAESLGTSAKVNYDNGLSELISKTNILVVEGYLFKLPDTIKAITKACKDAHISGALVAVTASVCPALRGIMLISDGVQGSYIGVKGEAMYIPPSPCVPVDTCGVGDTYASGILYGVLRGVSDLKDMCTLAARIVVVVVDQQGTRLRVQDAVELAESYSFHLENSGI